jgi:hypothetical protein
MIGFLLRSLRTVLTRSRRSERIARQTQLSVERMEARDCPAAPVLVFHAQVLAGHEVQLTGAVLGPDCADATVTFSGAAPGFTTTDANGKFLFTTDAASLGTVQAVAVDVDHHSSNVASETLAVPAPVISLQITHVTQNGVTLTGEISDPNIPAGGLPVTITGVDSGSVMSNSKGSFQFTISASTDGPLEVSTTDAWGQTSNDAEVEVPACPPAIQNFRVIQIGELYQFTGTVVGGNVAGLTVQFGGLPSIAGHTATVQANGTFSMFEILQPGERGIAWAQVTDQQGQKSNLAMDLVIAQ